MIVIGLLLWVFVLKGLSEVYNDFKKVLKTLPAEIVLARFSLKNFLMRTSKGALNSDR